VVWEDGAPFTGHPSYPIKYTPARAANFPAKFRDPDGQLTAWRITPVGILTNTDLVKANDVPKSWDDLLNPKWQEKITMPDHPAGIFKRMMVLHALCL